LVVEGLIDAVAPQREAGRFCEVGFGGGWLMTEFARRFPKACLFGFDLSEEFCERAQACLPTAAIVRGDMEALPFRERAFDCVASCCALYFARDIGRAPRE
jgi:trans-aconitate methyltransferase